jgi:hypothetical protein
MRAALSLTFIATGAAASASQPIGKAFGPWHVVSISSLSGGEGNDASVILTQGEEPNKLQARWTQGGPVVVSINIEKCSGDDAFEAFYSVDPMRWLQMSRRTMRMRLRADVVTWLAQAKLACHATSAVDAFKIDSLDAAATDFSDRLRYFAGKSEPSTAG